MRCVCRVLLVLVFSFGGALRAAEATSVDSGELLRKFVRDSQCAPAQKALGCGQETGLQQQDLSFADTALCVEDKISFLFSVEFPKIVACCSAIKLLDKSSYPKVKSVLQEHLENVVQRGALRPYLDACAFDAWDVYSNTGAAAVHAMLMTILSQASMLESVVTQEKKTFAFCGAVYQANVLFFNARIREINQILPYLSEHTTQEQFAICDVMHEWHSQIQRCAQILQYAKEDVPSCIFHYATPNQTIQEFQDFCLAVSRLHYPIDCQQADVIGRYWDEFERFQKGAQRAQKDKAPTDKDYICLRYSDFRSVRELLMNSSLSQVWSAHRRIQMLDRLHANAPKDALWLQEWLDWKAGCGTAESYEEVLQCGLLSRAVCPSEVPIEEVVSLDVCVGRKKLGIKEKTLRDFLAFTQCEPALKVYNQNLDVWVKMQRVSKGALETSVKPLISSKNEGVAALAESVVSTIACLHACCDDGPVLATLRCFLQVGLEGRIKVLSEKKMLIASEFSEWSRGVRGVFDSLRMTAFEAQQYSREFYDISRQCLLAYMQQIDSNQCSQTDSEELTSFFETQTFKNMTQFFNLDADI